MGSLVDDKNLSGGRSDIPPSGILPPEGRYAEGLRVFGIAVYFYFADHQPPHFHAFYAGFEAQIDIETLQVRRGRLPPRAYGLLVEWAMLHRDDLRRAWRQALTPSPIDPIEPLP